MTADFKKHTLNFKRPGGTSRGVLHTKDTFLLTISKGEKLGIGECALFRGLSADDVPEYEQQLQWLCENIDEDFHFLKQELKKFPSILMGLEQALLNLEHGKNLYFPSEFTTKNAAIKINGLIWMGDTDFMQEQITEKLSQGFSCIKLKIGSNWDDEFKILQKLREKFSPEILELRVDANGAFSFQQAELVLNQLADLKIHSIEQPIKAGRPEEMKTLCAQTPVSIALDEELIGIFDRAEKQNLLDQIQPQYIILKPSLVGGFSGSDEWIAEAEKRNIGWWITSALESNIGLNAIAQYTFTKAPKIPQGLGTGGLFTNNSPSVLDLQGDQLRFSP